MLIENHGKELTTNTLNHSDQGYHYTSHNFIKVLKDVNLRQSMSRGGNCWEMLIKNGFCSYER